MNVTIGAGIFVLPAQVSAQLGAAAPAAYLVCAVVMALVVASFALVGSRVSVTGGIYAYVEAAFGPFLGVLAGAVQYLVLWLTASGLLSAFADQVSLLVPGAGQGAVRVGGDLHDRGAAGVRERARRQARRAARGGHHDRQAAAARAPDRRRRLLARSREPGLARLAVERRARRQRAAADLRVRGDRGGARPERRAARPGAHGAARNRPRARRHHRAVPGDPGGGAGCPRQRAAAERERPARGRRRPRAGRGRAPAGPARRERLGVRLPERRHAGLAALDLRVRPRRAAAGCLRFGAPALPHAAPGDRHPRGAHRHARRHQHLHRARALVQRRRALALLPRLRGRAALRAAARRSRERARCGCRASA